MMTISIIVEKFSSSSPRCRDYPDWYYVIREYALTRLESSSFLQTARRDQYAMCRPCVVGITTMRCSCIQTTV